MHRPWFRALLALSVAALAILIVSADRAPAGGFAPRPDALRPARAQPKAPTPAPPPFDPAGPPAAHLVPQAIGDSMPRSGDQKLLIILFDFPDLAGLFTGQAWRTVFFGAGGFSEYFQEISYSQLRYTGDVVGMKSGAPAVNSSEVAYIRLPNPITFYADGLYGFKIGAGQFPRNNAGAVAHALQILDGANFDFSPYADPATKRVENLIAIFAGSTHAYTRDPNNSLEATGYKISFAGGSAYTTQGGQILDNFTICPDQRLNLTGLIAFIGVCAHEQGHSLGMPDLYDFSFTTSGAGTYDVMAYGTFGATSGQRPFHPSAFTKEFFGWANPTTAALGASTAIVGPAETGANFVKLFPNGNQASQEYFLLENRQPLGFDQDWSGRGLCAGLLIWHIDQAIVAANTFDNKVNTLASAGGPAHQGVIVVEADGGFHMITPSSPVNYGECADTWTVGRTWDSNSTPNSRLWDGSLSNLSVSVLALCSNGGVLVSIQNGGSRVLPSISPLATATPSPFGLFLPYVTRNTC